MSETLTCPSCARQVSTDDAFCGECGAAVAAPLTPVSTGPADPFTAALESSPAQGTDGLDALAGASMPNEEYTGQRLMYAKDVENFDPVAGRFVAELYRHLALYVLLLFPAAVTGFFAAMVIGFVISMELGQLLAGLIFFAGLVLWIVLMFRPIPVSLSEWNFMIDGKADAASNAFEHITWALQRRQTPLSKLGVRRLSQPGQDTRDYLEVRERIFVGYVSTFAYGRDLFIGWTMWWHISPFRWFLIVLGRLWQTFTLRGSQLHIIARYENAKAMREALHGAAREGLDVATGAVTPQGQGTIGSAIPVELVSGPSGGSDLFSRAESGQQLGPT
jgi:hypothetical protein